MADDGLDISLFRSILLKHQRNWRAVGHYVHAINFVGPQTHTPTHTHTQAMWAERVKVGLHDGMHFKRCALTALYSECTIYTAISFSVRCAISDVYGHMDCKWFSIQGLRLKLCFSSRETKWWLQIVWNKFATTDIRTNATARLISKYVKYILSIISKRLLSVLYMVFVSFNWNLLASISWTFYNFWLIKSERISFILHELEFC